MSTCKAFPSRLPPIRRAAEVKTLADLIPCEVWCKSSTRRSFALLSLPMSTLLILPSNPAFCAPHSIGFDPVTDAERDASSVLSRHIDDAVRLLNLGREFQAKGDFPRALDNFNQVIIDYKDLAFAEYARVGRALILYEIGDREQAIREMEAVSISLKGYPGVELSTGS